MKSLVAESDFLFRDARVPRQQPSNRLQASVGENQNASAAGSPSKPEDYHRVNTLFTSLDKVLAEIVSVEMTKLFFVITIISTRSYFTETNACSIVSKNTCQKINEVSGRCH